MELWNGWKYDLEQHRLDKEKGLPKPAFIKNFTKVTIYEAIGFLPLNKILSSFRTVIQQNLQSTFLIF